MKQANAHELPDAMQPVLRRGTRLAVITLIYMATAAALMGLVMGESQAMRTAFVEDLLVLIPPSVFLIAAWITRHWPPNDRYPYGYHRVVTIAFLISAVALVSVGLLLLYRSGSTLVRQHHPTISSVHLFGVTFWQGWLMLAVLVYSAVGPVLLGRLMIKPAEQLHDKVLHANAVMLRADWLTAAAAFVGVLGIAIGWWWADAVAAIIVSVEVIRDGGQNLKAVIGDLMDRAPDRTDLTAPEDLPDRLRAQLHALPWVADVDLRMRENGHVFFTDIFIVPVNEDAPLARTAEAVTLAENFDWRINTAIVQLVPTLATGD